MKFAAICFFLALLSVLFGSCTTKQLTLAVQGVQAGQAVADTLAAANVFNEAEMAKLKAGLAAGEKVLLKIEPKDAAEPVELPAIIVNPSSK